MAPMSACEKLIVALDLPTADAAARVAEKLRGCVGMFKVGSELFTAEGPVLARYLIAQGEKVFLDLKYHDIPHTVRAAAREAAQVGVSMLNVHALGGRRMMEAALEGVREAHRGGSRPLVLAVTLLTSLSEEDLRGLGIVGSPEEAVVNLALLAQKAGLDGVVASPQEVRSLRRACGPGFLIVTPGIRPALARTDPSCDIVATGAQSAPLPGTAADADDQARIATPEAAIRAGADFLVVGRPILEAPDLVAAAEAIVVEMQKALASAPRSAGPVL